LEVGFYPESPRPGAVTLHFHIWEDLDGNGVQNGQEPDTHEGLFGVSLKQTDGTVIGYIDGYTSIGQNWLYLSNYCGTVWVDIIGTLSTLSQNKWITTTISPVGASVPTVARTSGESREFEIPFDFGTTNIEWGWQKVE